MVVSSSSPSSPRNTQASTPRRANTPAMSGAVRGSAQPMACAAGRAGLASGPRRLKVVADAELAPGHGGVPQGRVEGGGEAEGDAGLARRPRATCGRGQVEPDAEPLQHVGGAGLRGGGAVAVLDHGGAGSGRDDRRPSWRCSPTSTGRRRFRPRRAPVPAPPAGSRARTSPRPAPRARRRSRPWPAAPPRSRRSGPGWRRRRGSVTSPTRSATSTGPDHRSGHSTPRASSPARLPRPGRRGGHRPTQAPEAERVDSRSRRTATSPSSSGSIGCGTAPSARDHVASQAS